MGSAAPQRSKAQAGQSKAGGSTTTASSKNPNPPAPLSPQNIFLGLLALRLANALIIQTFFQPDEYFQALEPAWHFAFGENAGAWITWEWENHLRSAIHPVIFAGAYKLGDAAANILALDEQVRAEVLLAAPKVLQAAIAALGDLYTWKLSSYLYGARSDTAAATLLLTVASPWQWFCSTRTFSNSLETTLTVMALYHWPWHWAQSPLDDRNAERNKRDSSGLRIRAGDGPSQHHHHDGDEVTRLRRSLLCAAFGTILRPTNILIWVVLTMTTFVRSWKSLAPSNAEVATFLRETVLCGCGVLLVSAAVDRMFYDSWVFPPYNFLHFNVVQSLAVFYGNNNWHYYLSQGYPLLLTTALPFAAVGLVRPFRSAAAAAAPGTDEAPRDASAPKQLATVSLAVPAVLSVISHKEVRFIYPLLPALHVLAAGPLAAFFGAQPLASSRARLHTSTLRRLLLAALVALNVALALYLTLVHNSGLIHLTRYLRTEFETASAPGNMSVGMLMPCHSTPWRSHLQYPAVRTQPGINAWALTCEPPLNLSPAEKATYLDEADVFYADPQAWLKKHMSRRPPTGAGGGGGVSTGDFRKDKVLNYHASSGGGDADADAEDAWWQTRRGPRRPWPDYLVFFAQLEPTLQVALRGSGYVECRRLFNSHAHDDWRRTGDVVVWCVEERRAASSAAAAAAAEAAGDNMGRSRRWWNIWAERKTQDSEEADLAAVEQALHEGGQGQKVLGRKRGASGQKTTTTPPPPPPPPPPPAGRERKVDRWEAP